MPTRRITVFAMFSLVFCWILYPDSPAVPADPCQKDVQKFCAGVQPGGGRITNCLREHAAEISPMCRERVLGIQEQAQETVQACAPDVEKFCAGVPRGQGRTVRCLKEHESELSPACRAQSGELRDLMGRHSPCFADQEKFCGKVVPGAGRIGECLYSHLSELSPRCRPLIETAGKTKDQIDSFMDACRDDLKKFCKGVAPGGGRFVQCLRQHEAEISGPCKAALGPGQK